MQLHSKVCPSFHVTTPEVKISLDGVSESKSTTNSLDVYSSKFSKCRNIYPHRIVRPLNKYKVDNRQEFSSFLEDLRDNACQVTDFVGDNPKRATVREALTHAGYYACEYCEGKAVQSKTHDEDDKELDKKYLTQIRDIEKKIDLLQNAPCSTSSLKVNEDQINMLISIKTDIENQMKRDKKKSHLVWPSSTGNANLRDIDTIREIVDNIDLSENGDIPPLTQDELKGFTGHSLLLDVPDFDFVNGISCEYMHSICLGVVKRMLVLTFNLNEKRPRKTTRRLTSPSVYNNLMKSVKVPKEFSRRARNMDISVFKAQEFRNIALFFFVTIVHSIEKNAKERRLWCLLSFMTRSCCIPDEEFYNVNEQDIVQCSQQFYALYEKLFTVKNCTYNTHVFSSHLLQMRSRGPLTETSAFSFEAFYAELRRSFTPGTVSPVKQMLQKVMLRRSLTSHCCQTSIHLAAKDTQLECNSLIYTFLNNSHHFFVIDNIDNDNPDILNCYAQGRFPFCFNETPALNWSAVGVYKLGPVSEEITQVHRCHVRGKVIKVLNYLITCPINILREK